MARPYILHATPASFLYRGKCVHLGLLHGLIVAADTVLLIGLRNDRLDSHLY